MTLTKLETRWAEAAMGAIFPGSTAEGLADIRAMDIRGFLLEVMAYVPRRTALGLRVAIWVVALAPLFVLHRLKTLAGLLPAERERVVAALVASPSYGLRSMVMIVKTIGALLYAGDDRVRARMLVPSHPTGIVSLRVKRAQTA
jgi:hypothetical protein